MYEAKSIVQDTTSWLVQSWAAFVISTAAMLYGIWELPAHDWARAFLGIAFLFSVSASFTLAKTLRDRHEATKLVNRLSNATAEKIISEHERRKAA